MIQFTTFNLLSNTLIYLEGVNTYHSSAIYTGFDRAVGWLRHFVCTSRDVNQQNLWWSRLRGAMPQICSAM